MRDEFRQRTSGQLGEAMRDLRQEARQLDERQQEVADAIRERIDSRQRTLTDSQETEELAEQIDRQQENMATLIERMRQLSEQSETAEPLLSRKLYDTLREASTENVDRALEAMSELLRRNFLPQAQEVEQQAGEGIRAIREGVEEAAENVLGDETEALRLAREQIDELIRQVETEAAQANNQDPSPTSQAPGGARPGDANAPGRSGSSPDGTQPPDTESRAAQADRPGERNAREARPGGGSQGGRWNETERRGPLTGPDYRDWSDQLRDVEEMLEEQPLRERVARVRDRAKGMRAEFVRHGTEPQWDLVRSQIMQPLAELRLEIGERLAQLQSDEALVPIDRDPVPDRFAEIVRRYFENLGGDS